MLQNQVTPSLLLPQVQYQPLQVSGYESDLHTSSTYFLTVVVNTRACSNCRSSKIRCEVLPDAVACVKCNKSG
ncbi:hypothetical protein PISMIDRAFT_123511, partial [Pisolithus microcarpus 441]